MKPYPDRVMHGLTATVPIAFSAEIGCCSMTPPRKTFIRFMMAVSFAAYGLPLPASSNPSIAGDYICVKDCRMTDAPPSIEIDGSTARCMSELGGIYTGKLLTDHSVYCFNKTGVLSDDGKIILWSNGAIWKRR